MSEVSKHFNDIAFDYDLYKKKNWFYYSNLKNLLTTFIPADKRVLEIGCGTGDLLAHLNPEYGVGIDISSKMIKIAQKKWRNDKKLKFSTNSIEQIKGHFDYIFMSDVIEHLEAPEKMFLGVSKKMTRHTVFINTMANPKWEPILMLAEKLKLKMPEGKHYRISSNDFRNLIKRSGLKISKTGYTLLLPIYLPFLTDIVNKNLERRLNKLCFIEFLIAKKNFKE